MSLIAGAPLNRGNVGVLLGAAVAATAASYAIFSRRDL